MFFIGISIPFIGVLLILFVRLSNSRHLFSHTKRKKRLSLNINTIDSSNLYLTIQMHPFSNLDGINYLSKMTSIPLEDDEELMKCDLTTDFCQHDSIELRVEEDLDADDENDN